MASPSPDIDRFHRLNRAFREGDLAALRQELGDDPTFPDVIAHPALGYCLVQAIYSSPMHFIAELLAAGADPNVPTNDGFPPLIAAITCSEAVPGAPARDDVHELLALLLDNGADVDQRGIDDQTALHLAAAQGDLTAVELLLHHGADPEAVTRVDDPVRPVELAAAGGHEAVVARLSPLTVRPDWERAATEGSVAVLRRLVDRVGDVDATDAYGQTALMRAAHAGQTAAVDWLVGRGAALDHTAKYGLSALMLSVIAGHHDVARRLVRAGADVTLAGTGAPGFAGKTAADLAEDRGDRRLAAYIRAAPGAAPP